MNFQQLLADSLAPTAHRGEDYSHSFSGGYASVEEPTVGGKAHAAIWMPAYANGLTLAESSFMSFGYLWGLSGGMVNLPVGDPIMRVVDGGKVGAAMMCNNDSDCILGVCDEDIGGVRRCHPTEENCVIGAVEGILNFSEVDWRWWTFEVETKNREKSCSDSTHTVNCIDGIWQEPVACASGEVCVGGVCGLAQGHECGDSADCALGNCIEDFFGVKRCHKGEFNCIFNGEGIEYSPNQMACLNSTYQLVCEGPGWSVPISCEGECSQGSCSDYEVHIFYISKGKKEYITIPYKVSFWNLNNLFKGFPSKSGVNLWESSSWSSSSYGFTRAGVFQWTPDLILKPGQGVVINGENLDEDFSFVVSGKSFAEPISIDISKGTFIGVPVCSESYTASKILKEIEELGGDCSILSEWDLESQDWEKRYLNGTGEDFEISSYESYYITCNPTENIVWTPSC